MKEENSKLMNWKIQIYFDIFLNEALVCTIGSYMMNVKVLNECQSRKQMAFLGIQVHFLKHFKHLDSFLI